MAYPGNTELSPQAQDRVTTAFKQVVGKLQQGNREEAIIGLEFVGLANFAKLFTDTRFWWSVLMTLYYAALIIPSGIAVSLALALLLNNPLRAVAFYRSTSFMPDDSNWNTPSVSPSENSA